MIINFWSWFRKFWPGPGYDCAEVVQNLWLWPRHFGWGDFSEAFDEDARGALDHNAVI